MKKMFTLLTAAVMSVAIFAGCGKSDKATGIIDKIQKEGKIVVYTNPEFPPYEYLGGNKEITGAEIEIVHIIAQRLGVKAELVSAEFDSIIGTVQTGKADLGASGFTITDERKQLVSFSDPFIVSVQYLIVPENSPIKTAEDLAGKIIGGQNGTTGFLLCEDLVNKGILKDTKASCKSYNNAPDATVALKNGRCDAVVIDELVAISLAKKNPGFKAIPLVDKEGKGLAAPEEFGMIVSKGNEDLLKVVNQVINDMKNDGSLEAAVMRHNGFSVAQ